MPPVVTAMPLMPGATAAERLAHAQARVDQLDLLIDEKFEGLGEAGITRRQGYACVYVVGHAWL